MRPLDGLKPYERNARIHPPEQIEQIAASMREFGFTIPVLVDEQGTLIAGHGRVLAAQRLVADGREEFARVPVMVATGWSDAQRRAYTIADNRLGETSTWDPSLLRGEIGDLRALDFDLGSLGFDELFVKGLGAPSAGEIDPLAEWSGMPEFDQNNKKAFRSLPVHFKDEDAVAKFAELIGQKITEQTRFVWFPETEIETYVDKRYTTAETSIEPSGFRYGEALPAGFHIPGPFKWILDKDLKNNPFDRVVVRKGDRVMDCGAAVGTFTAAALEAGAARVKAYEPLPKNASVLRSNVEPYGPRVSVVQAALVPDRRPSVVLEAGSSFPGTHSIVSQAKVKTNSIQAAAINFRDELRQFDPQMIKLDIEGGEYSLLETLQPGDLAGVSCIFIEFHPYPDRDKLIAKIWRYLEAEGLEIVKKRLRACTALRK